MRRPGVGFGRRRGFRGVGGSPTDGGGGVVLPPETFRILTEAGDTIVTEASDAVRTEG